MKRMIAWFAENHVAANLLMGLLIMGGLVALPQTPQKAFPDIDVKMVTVGVPYLGAAPEEVEEGVCIRIEEELDGVEGVEKLRSTATEGACAVVVELFDDADESVALDEVKNRVDAIDTFPEETEKPVITLVTMKRSVMELALTGPGDERTLKILGQRVRDELAALPGITHVDLSNTRPYEVSIEVSEESLRRHGLSFSQVADAVRRSSLDLPGGSIKTEGGEILLRTKGQAYWGPQFERLVVLPRADGTRVLLGDVARVVDGFEDTDQSVRFNGVPAAIIRVFRVGEQDIIAVANSVKDYLRQARGRLPEGVQLTVWSDGSKMLRDRLDTLISSAQMGFLLVLLLLALFLRPRLSFWVSLGVPVSFLGALWVVSILGHSINAISTFGFILVLGILVDDAIVVGENIHTHQRRGDDPLDAARTGAQEVSIPVTFGVLTTVAAFSPLLLGPGTMGQIQAVIATVVIVCLFFSLVESQLVLPAHLGHGHAHSHSTEVLMMLIPVLILALSGFSPDLRTFAGLAAVAGAVLVALHWTGLLARLSDAFLGMQTRLTDAIESFTHHRFRRTSARVVHWRYTAVATAVALLVCTFGVLVSGRLSFSFFPPLDADNVSAKLTMPLGTPARVTQEAVLQLERSAARLRQELDEQYARGGQSPVQHVLAAVGGHPVTEAGGSSPMNAGRVATDGAHLGEVTVQLVPSEERDVATRAVADRWRELNGPIPDAVELIFQSSLFTVGEAIDLQLQGTNVDELREAATRVRAKLAEYPGVIDIADSFRSGKKEYKLSILPSGEALGLTLGDLARQVRQAFYGEEAQRIQRGRDDVRVMVRYTQEERRSLGGLDRMRIRTPDGSEVPFATVARAELGRGFSSIKRSDRQRVVNVTADVDRTVTTANDVLSDLRAAALPEILRDYPGVTYALEGEQREQQEAVGSLIPMFGIALFAIYALLAIPLRSYSQPLIIMSVIPFALVGSIGGHLLMGKNLSFMSIMGFIAASGVVVNSSLVLVHYVNNRRARGAALADAVSDAAVARFRPIVLTSLTTFAGLTPLMLNRSVQAQFLVPMAISLAFGVLVATLITLLVVPSGYVILEDLRGLGRRRANVEVLEESKRVA